MKPIVALQFSWFLLLPVVVLPLLRLGDNLRSRPIRTLATLSGQLQATRQPIAMLG